MTASKVLSESNLPPESQPWGRDIQDKIVQDALDAEALKASSLGIYKQLNAAISGAATELQGAQSFLYEMPSSQAGSITASGFSIPASSSFMTVISKQIQIPKGKSRAVVLVAGNMSLYTNTINPNIWMSLYAGSGTALQVPSTGVVRYDGTFDRIIQATSGATYLMPTARGATLTITLAVRSISTAVPPVGGQVILNWDVIYGGK